MADFHYPVRCQENGCGRPVEFKIASRWSDGHTAELKTYGLVCGQCLPAKLRQANAKHATCGRAEHETLGPPAVYRYGTAPLARDAELEASLNS